MRFTQRLRAAPGASNILSLQPRPQPLPGHRRFKLHCASQSGGIWRAIATSGRTRAVWSGRASWRRSSRPRASVHLAGSSGGANPATTNAFLAQPWFSLLARIALTSAFCLSAIGKTFDFPSAAAEICGLVGLEPAALFAAAVILVQLGGSLLVIWGGHLAWLGAGALGVFTMLATLIAHAWWTKAAAIERFRDFNTFWEHVGLVGGFMLAAVRNAWLDDCRRAFRDAFLHT